MEKGSRRSKSRIDKRQCMSKSNEHEVYRTYGGCEVLQNTMAKSGGLGEDEGEM